MAIKQEVIGKLLKDYKNPEDLLGEDRHMTEMDIYWQLIET